MKFSPDIIKTDRRTISISVRPDGKVTVHAPIEMSLKEIEDFINEKAPWIEKNLQKCDTNAKPPLTEEEKEELKKQALEYFPKVVKKYADRLGLTFGKITVKTQKTRWGSCSSSGNLNFNALLMLMPPVVRESVVAHEVCHLKYMNHSKQFYNELLELFPRYYECDRFIKEHGMELVKRLY